MGWVLPTGLVGHSMLMWVLCMSVSCIIKWGGGGVFTCLGRCTYNTGKAAVLDVVTKQSKATECHIDGGQD